MVEFLLLSLIGLQWGELFHSRQSTRNDLLRALFQRKYSAVWWGKYSSRVEYNSGHFSGYIGRHGKLDNELNIS